MTGHLLYPRLSTNDALQLLASSTGVELQELEGRGTISHPNAIPSPTGGILVDDETLLGVQRAIRAVALEAGYPSPLSRIGGQAFDRPCGTILFKEMGIVPADAAEEGVWSFLTLVLVPEIGPWRFPGLAEERLLGRPRNVLRRTWWRAWALGDDLDLAPTGCTPLGEDEFVQIMERPSLGGNRRVARAIRDTVWRAEMAGLRTSRSEFVRGLALRVLAVKSHIALEALTNDQLDSQLDQLANEVGVLQSGSELDLQRLPDVNTWARTT